MQTTSQSWRALLAAGAPLQARATIGGVVYTDISTPVITRALMQDRLSVGNVVSASLALAVRGAVNIPRSAAVVVEVRLNDGQAASEWLPQGTFYISRRMRDPVTGLLVLECYDALLKANAVWTPSAGAWPRTMAAVTAELAALLGVTLDSRTVIPTGAAYAMSEPAEGTTIRDALGVVAQAAGGNWAMTPAGLLRLVRVGESGDAVDVTGVVGGIDVGQAGTVTGVRCTEDGVVTLIGDDTGIVVDVSIAPMIAAEMATDLIGQAYAPFHLSGAIYDPAAELGDGVRAGAGGEVISALCSEQATYGPAFRGDIAAPDPGEVTDEYPYIGSAERTLALAKAAAIEAVDRLDDELTQQEIFNRLTDDGAAQGLLLYNGQLYINASYINAGYLSANHIQGGTLTLGGQGNQNGVLQVLDASGNVITVLNNAGADITNGSLTTYSTDRQTRTILSDGLLKFQFYNSAAQPIGWRDALRLAADSQSATIGTFAGIAELNISGRGRVKIKNSEGTTDPDYAEIDMDDDSVLLTATRNDGVMVWASLQVTKDGVTVSKQDTIGDPYVLFELAAGQSSKPLSIGNGGTGATTPADARANLGITPANIGAVSTSDVINVAHGGTNATTPAQARANLEITPANIGAVSTSAVIDITHGGTGVTTPAVTISAEYTSVLDVIDSIANTRAFPISVQKWYSSIYNDMPTGFENREWSMVLTGDAIRCTAFLYIYGDMGVFKRDYFNSTGVGVWLTGWIKVSPITPGDIGAVAKSGDTMTGPLSITPPSGEGGEIVLDAPGDDASKNGITIDNFYGKFRIYGIPSKDATTHTGYGVNLVYDPYTGILDSINGSLTLAPGYLRPSNPLDIPYGGTGATTPAQARANLEITPANIGAVDANALTIKPWGVNGESILANNGIYARSYNPNILPSQGAPTGFSTYASALSVIGSEYPIVAYIDVFGNLAIWNSNQNRWGVYHQNGYVYGIAEGGTGATTAAGARTDLGTSLYISSNTSATVYNQLNALNTSEAISAMLTETAANYLSGGKVTHAVDGVIRKHSATSYVFAMFDGYGYAYRWQANVTASGATVGNCFRFTGTQI